MLNVMESFAAKIRLNERQPLQYYVECSMALEIQAIHFVHGASEYMYHVPLPSPSYATLRDDFETTPVNGRKKKKSN